MNGVQQTLEQVEAGMDADNQRHVCIGRVGLGFLLLNKEVSKIKVQKN